VDNAFLLSLAAFFLFLLLGVPVAFSLGGATLLIYLLSPDFTLREALPQICQDLWSGPDSFVLLAIPFFILSGLLLGRGGIARRLIRFAQFAVGWLPGGLACVNVMACMLFGAVSGSAAAAASSIGSVLVPAMEEQGYDRDFSSALTMTAATTGLLIPPSNIMIVYAAVAQVSIGALFLAGFLPGVLTGLSLMAAAVFLSLKRGYKRVPFCGWAEGGRRFLDALPGLFLVVLVMGGITGTLGQTLRFTATEAAVVAVLYSLVLALVYREVKVSEIPGLLLETARITAFIMFLIGTSKAMGFALEVKDIPESTSSYLLSIGKSPLTVLLLVNFFLLVVGAFMDMTPAVLIFTPIFLPAMKALGIHPLHFGLILVANLCIGLVTPPVGTILFVGCAVGRTTIWKVLPSLVPFFLAMIFALAVTCALPSDLVLWLPRAFGFHV